MRYKGPQPHTPPPQHAKTHETLFCSTHPPPAAAECGRWTTARREASWMNKIVSDAWPSKHSSHATIYCTICFYDHGFSIPLTPTSTNYLLLIPPLWKDGARNKLRSQSSHTSRLSAPSAQGACFVHRSCFAVDDSHPEKE